MLGFDKNRSYWGVFIGRLTPLLKMSTVDTGIHYDMIAYIKENPEDLKQIIHSEMVQSALARIRSIPSQQRDFFTMMDPLINFIESKGSDPALIKKRKASLIHLFSDLDKLLIDSYHLTHEDLHRTLGPRDLLRAETKSGLQTLSFHPQDYLPKLLAPIEEDHPGGYVPDIVENAGALAGINGGFFGWGKLQRWWSPGWYMGNAKLLVLGKDDQGAFPSAILKTKQGLWNDTSEALPAIGWTVDGSKTAIGYLGVRWFATRRRSPDRLPASSRGLRRGDDKDTLDRSNTHH